MNANRMFGAALALLLVVVWPAATAEAKRTLNVDGAIQRKGESQQPVPRDAQVKVRDVKTGKVVGEGTIKAQRGGGTQKPAAIDVGPGTYDVEVYTKETDLTDPNNPKLDHYKGTQRVKVTQNEGSAGVDVVMKPLDRKGVLKHRIQDTDDDIDSLNDKIGINKRLRDAKKKANPEESQKHQERIEKLEKDIGRREKTKDKYQKELDKLEGKRGGKGPKGPHAKTPKVDQGLRGMKGGPKKVPTDPKPTPRGRY